jgi:hypothetical protein
VDEQTASLMIKHAFLAGTRSACPGHRVANDREDWAEIEPLFLAWVEQWNAKMRAGWKPDPLGVEADDEVSEIASPALTIRINNTRPRIHGTVGG